MDTLDNSGKRLRAYPASPQSTIVMFLISDRLAIGFGHRLSVISRFMTIKHLIRELSALVPPLVVSSVSKSRIKKARQSNRGLLQPLPHH